MIQEHNLLLYFSSFTCSVIPEYWVQKLLFEFRNYCNCRKLQYSCHVWSFWFLRGTQTNERGAAACAAPSIRHIKMSLRAFEVHTTCQPPHDSFWVTTYSHRPTRSCGRPQNVTFVYCAGSHERVKGSLVFVLLLEPPTLQPDTPETCFQLRRMTQDHLLNG